MRPETALDIETRALADHLISRLAAARGLAWPLAGEGVGPAQPDLFRSASNARPRVVETGEEIELEEIGREIVFWRVRDLVRGLRFSHGYRLHQETLAVLESPALAVVLAALGVGEAVEEVRARALRLAGEAEAKGLVAGEE